MLTPELELAYAQTHYRVLGVLPSVALFGAFTLRVGQVSAELDALAQQYGFATASYITAWNPYSRLPLPSRADNRAANQRLRADLQILTLPHFFAIGLDPQRQWLGEPGFLVLGLSHAQLRELCLRYGQYAAVFWQQGSLPQLLLAGETA